MLAALVAGVACLAALPGTSSFAAAQTPPDAAATPAKVSLAPLVATRTTVAPTIDGVLDDAAWTAAPVQAGEDWRSYNPLYGDQIQQHTTVWIAYDATSIYVAFKCDDPDPSGIKTSVTRRDNIWPDDWVGLSLDALGTGQTSYHLMVNPNGIQLDMVNTISGNEDTSPDWVWDSAARPTPTGYAVEIRLPLQMLRFKGGEEVRMGVLFWRRVSRTGVSVAWPALQPGRWVFDTHAPLIFKDLQGVAVREVIPSVTYTHREERPNSERWLRDNGGEVGVSGKWGLSTTITLEATLNPDFSQVESDAVQVEVNQRYPVFFSEKRPFFMEGAAAFNLAGNAQGDASMLYAVHTRKIVDPILGAKLTGSAGRVTFASLTAVDQGPGRVEDLTDRLSGREKIWQIARAQVSLKPGSYAGAIGTFTELAGRHNAVGGVDLNLRLSQSQRFTGFVLASSTTHDAGSREGLGTQLTYGYSSQRVNAQGQFEHYDRGFVMDTAFLNRVGFTSGWGYVDYSFYPDKTKYPWIRRISPFTFLQAGHDRIAGGDEIISVTGVRLSFTRQGFVRVDRIFGQEPWQHQEYDNGRTRLQASGQLFRWLRPQARVNWGAATYYDALDPFQGRSLDTSAGALIQPNGRFSEDVEFQRIAFDRATTGERVYTVSLVNTRTTYQFTRALAARAIIQYDGQRERVLTDFLGSYEPRPGTVVFVGYGSLYERRLWQDDRWLEHQGEYLTTRRGFFFKASYLYRF
ncbi:hypothetical protein LuPra_02182 [Luteitalea pratensis]|uniref:Uncharacterized protein n=2 Tax=Luteitalea pratensis TaxID=1855912 RepID=A0A143PMH8_LUTPR|nr:hypothetical protein LuPra_02182 [Luteitalea pratensis]